MENTRNISAFNKAIVVFIVIFLASLGNSIFVNQIGYYGALLLLIAKYFVTRERVFKKSGLEIYFILFIAAELISSIFALNHPQSFTNLFKRVLLLPISYVVLSEFSDIKKLKNYFYVYVGASILTIAYYLYKSYDYFAHNLFQVMQSGPAALQHPITSGEITSFVLVFLFAFIVNEKQSIRDKAITVFLFMLSAIALYATYKRTGWLAAAAGMGAILLAGKKWKLLIPLVAAGIALLLLQKSESKLYVYDYSEGKLTGTKVYDTPGRPSDMVYLGGKKYLADFDGGILKVSDTGELIPALKTSAPVEYLKRIDDTLFAASLIDTRFLFIEEYKDSLKIIDEAITPGLTVNFSTFGGKLYANDLDSGLTTIDAYNGYAATHLTELNRMDKTVSDSSYMVVLSVDKTELKVYSLLNGLPDTLLYIYNNGSVVNLFAMTNEGLLTGDNENIKLFKITPFGLEVIDENDSIKAGFGAYINTAERKLFILSMPDKLYEMQYPMNGKLTINSVNELGFTPKFVQYANGKIYAGHVKIGRISSIFDKYNYSNLGRLAFWEAGWKMFLDHPIFGVGDIDLAALYRQYKHPYNKEIEGHMHNNYIHVLVILGAFGFIIVMALFVKIFLLLWNNYKTVRGENFLSSIALGAFGAYISFLTAGLTEWNFGDHEIATLLWTAIGLSLAAANIWRAENR